MNYKEALQFIVYELDNLSNKEQESYWILEFITQKSRSYITQKPDDFLSEREIANLKKMVFSRKQNYPLQYLLGTADFMGLSFKTCKNVLIPREDTGVLVEYILCNAKKNAKILDIGTGSGTISLTLKKLREDLEILATDISSEAIECTRMNEKYLFGKNSNIRLKQTDLFQDISEIFDIIVSNPPYLTEEERLNSDKEILFEPKSALVAQDSGFFFYQEIITQGWKFLKPDGALILEISPLRLDQMLFFLRENNSTYTILKDIHSNERAVVIRKKKNNA